MTEQLQKLLDSFSASIVPPEELSLAEWSAKNAVLSPEASAVRGRFEAWPFQVEPMEVISPRHPSERVALMCASQTMKTQLILNMLGFIIDVDPGPTLIIEPTADDAESLSKDRVSPMLRDTPCLRGKVTEAKSRDAGNTIDHKRFHGGHVTFAYATAPSKLAMRPIRYLFFDEVSRYNMSSGKEGDPVRLGEKRTVTFWNRKLIYASSPGNEGTCRISDIFAHSDQREWFVPCPHCGHRQILKFGQLKWGSVDHSAAGKPAKSTIPVDDPVYQCEGCEQLITHGKKSWMLANGEWRPMSAEGKYPGFRISQLASPVRTWSDIVQEWIECQGKPEQLKVFVNTVLAETWKEIGDAPDHEKLYGRRENYSEGQVQSGVLFLTAGADVQKDRIEVSVYGWGRDSHCWLIEHHVLSGRTSDEKVWRELSEFRHRTWRHPGGAQMGIVRFMIDSGYETTMTYAWVRQQADPSIFAIDGRDHLGGMVLGQPSSVDVTVRGRKVRSGLKIWPVDTSKLKSELYGRLNLATPAEGEQYPARWVHLPQVSREFCEQLTAEEVVTEYNNRHYPVHKWKKRRERNEALDCWVYARAGAHQLETGMSERRWKQLEASLQANTDIAVAEVVAPETEPTKEEIVPAPPKLRSTAPRPQIIRSRWLMR